MNIHFLSAVQAVTLAFFLLLSGLRPAHAQQTAPSQAPSQATSQAVAQAVTLDVAGLRRQLTAPAEASARPGVPITYRISLPTLRGVQAFVLSETFVVPASDVAAHQRLRTFVGNEANNPAHRVALVLTPTSLTADLLAGSESASLRPAASGPGYLLRAEQATTGPCGTLDGVGGVLRPNDFATMPAPFSFGTQVRRLKYAILVTKEYYVANGNTDAAVELSVVAAMNKMSALYLQELSLSFELVKPTGGARYFSAMTTATLPGSDPATPGRLRDSNLDEVGAIIEARYVPSTFDMGHCFQDGGGGVAFVGVICNSVYKARAWSGVGAGGFQGILAHEMGHQFGAYHTFAGPCGSNNERSRLEPGGGATVMAYTDVCGAQTLQDVVGSDGDYFNLHSLDQMRNNLVGANTCPTIAANTNRPPTLNAGADYTIPRNTPFTLTATGSDPDNDALTYTWNQFDYSPTNIGALGSIAGAGGLAAVDDPNAPLFRPRAPRPTPSRTFPDLRYVLANANRPADLIGEALPNVGRDLHFVVTARDQRPAGGTITTDNVTLTVAPNTGPFALTTQNTPATAALWIAGRPATVTWSVNGTDQAPISVSQVRISLSTDGGQTFGTVLAATAPNSGTATVTLPNVTTTRARVRVEAVGNIFFDINDTDFPVGPCTPVASQTLPATALTAAAGTAALNLEQLGLGVIEYAGTTQLAGTISATDPVAPQTNLNGGTCMTFNNTPTNYDTYTFVPTTTGAYKIEGATGFTKMLLRLYPQNSFVAATPCQNLLADNFDGWPRVLTASLTAGRAYTLVVSNFGGALPGNTAYSIRFTSTPAGGTAFSPAATLDYDYGYVVVNTGTNNVVQVAPTADLRALGGGVYDVYGLLFQRGYATAGLRGSSLSALQAALGSSAPCGQLSRNARRVTITGNPLPVVAGQLAAPSLEMAAYPNPTPAGAALQLRLQARETQTVRLLVADALGRVVLRRTVTLPAGTTQLALPEARQWHGLYVLSAHTATGRLRQNVVLE